MGYSTLPQVLVGGYNFDKWSLNLQDPRCDHEWGAVPHPGPQAWGFHLRGTMRSKWYSQGLGSRLLSPGLDILPGGWRPATCWPSRAQLTCGPHGQPQWHTGKHLLCGTHSTQTASSGQEHRCEIRSQHVFWSKLVLPADPRL